MDDLAFDRFGCTDASFARVFRLRADFGALVVHCQELNRILLKSKNDRFLGLSRRPVAVAFACVGPSTDAR
jgi:hypothetical protein